MSNNNLIKSDTITYNDLFEYVIDKICSTCENAKPNYDLSTLLNNIIKNNVKTNYNIKNDILTCSYTSNVSYWGRWPGHDSGGPIQYSNNIKTNIKYNLSEISEISIPKVSKEDIKKDLTNYLTLNGISSTNIINFKTIMNFFGVVSIFLENAI